MTTLTNPFPLPTELSPDLSRVMAYWKGLIRGQNQMPFWDDVNLANLPDLTDRVLLIDVFDRPDRFRFSHIGEALKNGAAAMTGKFTDDLDGGGAFGFLDAQCSATVEASTPTFYRHDGGGVPAFSRLLLPMWGEGRIGMLLGAVDYR